MCRASGRNMAPPSRVERCDVREAIIAEGSVLKGARITNSIVGIRSIIGEDVVLERTLMMGADYYEDQEDEDYNRQLSVPNIGIGQGSIIRNAIIDKNAHIGSNVRLINESRVQNRDGSGFYIRDGIIIVPKNGVIPDGSLALRGMRRAGADQPSDDLHGRRPFGDLPRVRLRADAARQLPGKGASDPRRPAQVPRLPGGVRRVERNDRGIGPHPAQLC